MSQLALARRRASPAGPRAVTAVGVAGLRAGAPRARSGVPRRTQAFWAAHITAQRRGKAKGMPKTRIRGRGEQATARVIFLLTKCKG
eukprot:scaffold62683_cov57-Phaeocystis_antarctica.AAC.2